MRTERQRSLLSHSTIVAEDKHGTPYIKNYTNFLRNWGNWGNWRKLGNWETGGNWGKLAETGGETGGNWQGNWQGNWGNRGNWGNCRACNSGKLARKLGVARPLEYLPSAHFGMNASFHTQMALEMGASPRVVNCSWCICLKHADVTPPSDDRARGVPSLGARAVS